MCRFDEHMRWDPLVNYAASAASAGRKKKAERFRDVQHSTRDTNRRGCVIFVTCGCGCDSPRSTLSGKGQERKRAENVTSVTQEIDPTYVCRDLVSRCCVMYNRRYVYMSWCPTCTMIQDDRTQRAMRFSARYMPQQRNITTYKVGVCPISAAPGAH